MFIDVHCHLDLLENLENVLDNSRDKKVEKIVSAGVDIETNRKMLKMSKEHKEIDCVLGIYPDEALKLSDEKIEEEINFIRANKNKIIGIGEVGVDFSKGEKDRGRQLKIFEKFIALSLELNKPIIVHSRKAEVECIEALDKLGAKKVLIHYFSGSMKLVDRIIKNDWFLSTPTCVKRSEHFQNLIKIVPIKQLLCETDSPYSHPDKKFPNEPANVVESYKKIAEIKNINLKKVEEILGNNFKTLFGKA